MLCLVSTVKINFIFRIVNCRNVDVFFRFKFLMVKRKNKKNRKCYNKFSWIFFRTFQSCKVAQAAACL